jgi:hypothetical protein
MKRALIALALALCAGLSFALPTVQDVEAQVRQGNYAQAETMMKEVVAAKPGSARAHYVYAEILARNGRVADAAGEAERARTLDPALSFTSDPQRFRDFERLLQRDRAGATPLPGAGPALTPGVRSDGGARPSTAAPVSPAAPTRSEPASGGVPSWLWGAGIAVVAFLLWRSVSRRRAAAAGMAGPVSASAAGSYPGPQGPGYGPGYGPGAAPASRGGGLLGAGLAGAGGFAAGMLADRLMHGRDAANAGSGGHDALSNLGPGGDDTVRFDDPAAGGELASRDVDFGTGGNDWSDAGSVDSGGGGDGGGGWDT